MFKVPNFMSPGKSNPADQNQASSTRQTSRVKEDQINRAKDSFNSFYSERDGANRHPKYTPLQCLQMTYEEFKANLPPKPSSCEKLDFLIQFCKEMGVEPHTGAIELPKLEKCPSNFNASPYLSKIAVQLFILKNEENLTPSGNAPATQTDQLRHQQVMFQLGTKLKDREQPLNSDALDALPTPPPKKSAIQTELLPHQQVMVELGAKLTDRKAAERDHAKSPVVIQDTFLPGDFVIGTINSLMENAPSLVDLAVEVRAKVVNLSQGDSKIALESIQRSFSTYAEPLPKPSPDETPTVESVSDKIATGIFKLNMSDFRMPEGFTHSSLNGLETTHLLYESMVTVHKDSVFYNAVTIAKWLGGLEERRGLSDTDGYAQNRSQALDVQALVGLSQSIGYTLAHEGKTVDALIMEVATVFTAAKEKSLVGQQTTILMPGISSEKLVDDQSLLNATPLKGTIGLEESSILDVSHLVDRSLVDESSMEITPKTIVQFIRKSTPYSFVEFLEQLHTVLAEPLENDHNQIDIIAEKEFKTHMKKMAAQPSIFTQEQAELEHLEGGETKSVHQEEARDTTDTDQIAKMAITLAWNLNKETYAFPEGVSPNDKAAKLTKEKRKGYLIQLAERNGYKTDKKNAKSATFNQFMYEVAKILVEAEISPEQFRDS